MNRTQFNRARWLVVVLFALAMAWAESAVVFYLRTMSNRIAPYQADPLPPIKGITETEMVREAATMIMLLAVGWLAGRHWRSRLGYTLVAFGVWDICYYVFLRVLTGWPQSLLDWDVLFLLPLPWWGPVAAPMGIALLMILWGTIVTQSERAGVQVGHNWRIITLSFLGVALALYAFMADAIRVVGQGEEALRKLLPTSFNWGLFSVAFLLMAAPVWDARRQVRRQRQIRLR